MVANWFFASIALLGLLSSVVQSTPLLYDGRAPLNLTEAVFDDLSGPYTFVVKGSKLGSDYVDLSTEIPPTPLWSHRPWQFAEQTISVSIDNSSVFVPGGNEANSQFGFRRTEVIAQPSDRTIIETGVTVFHFSVMRDNTNDLNFAHEYQPVFIEPSDGSHVFGLQIGTPFSNPPTTLAAAKSQVLRILSHDLTVLSETPFTAGVWHNFAIQVDWDNLTLGVFASCGAKILKAVTPKAVANTGVQSGALGQGDFHFGTLKLPLADPNDPQANDVVHRGIQEGTLERLHYSGVFVEGVDGGISAGYGLKIGSLDNA